MWAAGIVLVQKTCFWHANDFPLVQIIETALQRDTHDENTAPAPCGKDPETLGSLSLWKHGAQREHAPSECVLGELSATEHTHELQRYTHSQRSATHSEHNSSLKQKRE